MEKQAGFSGKSAGPGTEQAPWKNAAHGSSGFHQTRRSAVYFWFVCRGFKGKARPLKPSINKREVPTEVTDPLGTTQGCKPERWCLIKVTQSVLWSLHRRKQPRDTVSKGIQKHLPRCPLETFKVHLQTVWGRVSLYCPGRPWTPGLPHTKFFRRSISL